MTPSPKTTRVWLVFGTSFVAFIAMAQYLRPPPVSEETRTLAACIAENRSFAAHLSRMEQEALPLPAQTADLQSTRAALDKMDKDAEADPQMGKMIAQEMARTEATRQRDGTRDPLGYATHEIEILTDCVGPVGL